MSVCAAFRDREMRLLVKARGQSPTLNLGTGLLPYNRPILTSSPLILFCRYLNNGRCYTGNIQLHLSSRYLRGHSVLFAVPDLRADFRRLRRTTAFVFPSGPARVWVHADMEMLGSSHHVLPTCSSTFSHISINILTVWTPGRKGKVSGARQETDMGGQQLLDG